MGGNNTGGGSHSLSTKKLSKFQLMDKSRSGREVDIHGGGQDGVGTHTKHGQGPYNASENSSEEAIYIKRQPPPQGKIGVRTDIATFYEEA